MFDWYFVLRIYCFCLQDRCSNLLHKNSYLFQVVSKDIARNSVVVFDEAHNIDNICIDSMSVRLTKRLLNKCVTSITTLEATIKQQKDANSDKLKSEYEKLVEGLRQASKK